MADDDDINLRFGGDTSGVTEATGKVKSDLEDVNPVVQQLQDQFERLGERIIEAFAIREVAEFVNHLLEAGEQIERIQAMTGLSSESIQSIGFALERTGGSAEQVGQMMVRFERNVQTAVSGSGTAFDAFQRLGVSLDDLKHKSIDQLLDQTAAGFRNITDPVERATLALDVGSRSFAQMLPAMLASQEGTKAFEDRLKELNALMNENTVQALSNTHKGFVDMGEAVKGAGIQTFMLFHKEIDGVVACFTDAIVDIGRLIGWLRELQLVIGADVVIACARLVEAMKNTATEASFAVDAIIIRWKEAGAIMTEVATLNWSKIKDVQGEADAQLKESAQNAVKAIQQHEKEYDNLKAAALAAMNQIIATENAASKNEGGGGANRTPISTGAGGGLDAADQQFIWMSKEHIKDVETEEKATAEATKAMTKHYEDMFQPIDRGFNTMVTGILSGTQTWQQALSHAFSNMLVSFLEADAKMLEKHIASELAKTSATEAGNAARTGSDIAASTASSGFSAAKYIAEIEGDAAKTYASVFAWASPAMGPFAAIPAGAAAALVGGMAALVPSFDVGTNYVPQTGLAIVHQGERITPASQNNSDMGGGGTNISITIQAIDTQSGANFLKQNAGIIANTVAMAVRNQNSSLSKALRG